MRRSVKRRRKTEKRRRGGGAKIKWYLRTCDSCPLTHRSASVIDRERVFKKDWFRRAKIFFFFFCANGTYVAVTPLTLFHRIVTRAHFLPCTIEKGEARMPMQTYERAVNALEMQNSYTSLGGRLFDWAAAIVRRGI